MLCRFTLRVAFFAQFAGAVFGQNYNFNVVLNCGQLTLFPSAMNNSGVIVGAAHAINSVVNSGFVYAKDNCKSFDFGGIGAAFGGITSSNAVIGVYADREAGTNVDFELNDGKITNLPAYPNAFTSYFGWQSATGLYAGNYEATSTDDGLYTGFLYQDGKFISLPRPVTNGLTTYLTIAGLNDNNVVVGTVNGTHQFGFALQNGSITYVAYPGVGFTTLNGINNDGVAVGTYYSNISGGGYFTYDLNTKQFTTLNWPYPYNGATPVGITDSGVIAALYSAPGGLLIATPTGN